MSKIAVYAKLTAKPGRREELVEKMGPMFKQVDGESGCERYIMHSARHEPDAVWMYEVYTDREALQAHQTSDAMQRAIIEWGDVLAGTPEIVVGEPIRAKGD